MTVSSLRALADCFDPQGGPRPRADRGLTGGEIVNPYKWPQNGWAFTGGKNFKPTYLQELYPHLYN